MSSNFDRFNVSEMADDRLEIMDNKILEFFPLLDCLDDEQEFIDLLFSNEDVLIFHFELFPIDLDNLLMPPDDLEDFVTFSDGISLSELNRKWIVIQILWSLKSSSEPPYNTLPDNYDCICSSLTDEMCQQINEDLEYLRSKEI
ncbi:unnamed protein product [Dimorphilus gyrociliatus]|uniref:Uncharacterized protein n=1 Tax=Dimorphilus gyrociliatus TaxID=2664684 RepID=A0A7I8VWG2_9ANNE|nr:unnamed protein product [Dimorphilus gyrociliatus]